MSDSTWPFDDEPDTAALSVAEVLDGSREVLYVTHDVDGTWQFLTGDEVGGQDGAVVALGDVVASDASLGELADLPYGWEASRVGKDAVWDRRACFPTDWQTLVEEAVHYLESAQKVLTDRFAIDALERFEYERESARIRFFDGEDRTLVADVRIVGSRVDSASLWVWSWADGSVAETEHEDMIGVAAFGQQHGFDKLHDDGWPADEYDAWEMTAVAAMLLEAEGAYCVPHDRGSIFMILTDVRHEEKEESA